MHSRVSELSGFVLDLHAQSYRRGFSSLVSWSVSELSGILGFDSAWFGWFTHDQQGFNIHTHGTHNLPDNYYDHWIAVADQDVLVSQYCENPQRVPTYDRRGELQTDGMELLADAFGLSKIATAACLQGASNVTFFLSAYRTDRHSSPWSESDCEFLQCAVNNIAAAARKASHNELNSNGTRSASIYVSPKGKTLTGLQNMQEQFSDLWPQPVSGDLPEWLSHYTTEPGEHLLTDRELVITCVPVSANGLDLHKLSLRELRKTDFLTTREKQVASVLAQGKSHKEAAKSLGVAPATIRNQTQIIYRKLGIDNRASLVSALSDGPYTH